MNYKNERATEGKSSPTGEEDRKNPVSDEIALMRAEYDKSNIKQEKMETTESLDINSETCKQICLAKLKRVEDGNTYDAIKSLLESNADLDRAIGQLLQKESDRCKAQREGPEPICEPEKVIKEEKETEGFENNYPGQGQPVFPSQENYMYNNQFSQCSANSNGFFFEHNHGEPNSSNPPPGPTAVTPAQFGSFQGWYTLQGVGGPIAAPLTPNHFECPFCGVILANKTNLKNHINSAHTRTKKFNCPTCGKVFYTSSAMNIHRRRNHLGLAKKYRCSLCTKMFKIKSDLSAHMLDVHNKPRKLSPKTLHRLSQKVAQHLSTDTP